MRERLIELFKKTKYKVFPNGATDYNLADQFNEFALNDIVDKFLANGVIVPPCKCGDMVYCVAWHSKKIYTKMVEEILIREDEGYIYCACSYMPFEQFGKTVFLTREEAEKALNNIENGNS